MKKIKWLLVGAGDIARKRVAPALAGVATSEIESICDINPESAESLASQFNCKNIFTDFKEALLKSDTDAVYIALPVYLHIPMALEAINSKRHILVEKPLGLNTEECKVLLNAVEKKGVKAACAYFRRFYSRYIYTKKMIEKGEFGQVVLIRMLYYSWFNPSKDDPKYWRVVRTKSGGGVLSDMGTHMFDVLIGLFGLPVSVYARCENLVHKWDVEDSAVMIMKMSNGTLVTASFNWNSQVWRHEFEIVGTLAKINWLPYDSGPVVKTVGRNIENLELPSAENVHLPLVDDFVNAILEEREPLCSLSEAVKTNILLDAVYRSAKENKEVRI